ncbi:hypothetical protein SVIOM342S_08055 [Streptomyces violaceorubidus]
MSYASSSTASFSSVAIPWKNTGYCARSTCSFHTVSNPPASRTSSARSMVLGDGIRRPCSYDATVAAE